MKKRKVYVCQYCQRKLMGLHYVLSLPVSKGQKVYGQCASPKCKGHYGTQRAYTIQEQDDMKGK